MSKVKIFTDSGSDITKEMAKEADVTVLPFLISFGDETFKEFYEINQRQFYEKMKETGIIPKTAQITPNVFEEAFREALKEYDTVIYISLSSTLTSTLNSANIAKQVLESEQPGADIVLIDSKTVTLAYGLIAYKAGLMAKAGGERDEIIAFINDMIEKMNVYFVIDDLQYLQKGGRISSTKLMLGTLLDIRPLLKMQDGNLVQFEKIRGSKNVVKKLTQIAKRDIGDFRDYCIVFGHTDALEKMQELKAAMLEGENEPGEQYELEIGCSIGTHGGPGIVAVFFYKL